MLQQWPFVKIVVIEDQKLVREFVARVCDDAFAHPEIYHAADAKEGLQVAHQAKPDLIILDLDLPDKDGLDLVADLRSAARAARILILSSHVDAYAVHRFQNSGADGFADKNEQSAEALCDAMRQIVAGNRFFSTQVKRAQAALRADPKGFTKLLTDREIEVLRYFGEGLSDDQAGERVGIHGLTVRNHRRNLMMKLGIHSSPELLRYALDKGFTRIRPRS